MILWSGYLLSSWAKVSWLDGWSGGQTGSWELGLCLGESLTRLVDRVQLCSSGALRCKLIICRQGHPTFLTHGILGEQKCRRKTVLSKRAGKLTSLTTVGKGSVPICQRSFQRRLARGLPAHLPPVPSLITTQIWAGRQVPTSADTITGKGALGRDSLPLGRLFF